MRRALLLLAAIFQVGYSQNVTIQHAYYTTTFSETLRIPVVVKWWLTKEMVSCPEHLKRTNKFTADPLLPNHTRIWPRIIEDLGTTAGTTCRPKTMLAARPA